MCVAAPLIMRTTNGVAATLNARPCAGLFVASLVNARATAAAILARKPAARSAGGVAPHRR